MKSILFAIPVLLISANAFGQTVEADIRNTNHQFEQAFGKKDAAALGRMYTDHAVALPPGSPMAEGRDAIQKLWQNAIDVGIQNLSLHTIGVEDYGNAARELGRFTLDAPDENQNMVTLEGKYVVIWKKTGDGWRLDTDIWNFNE